MFDIFFKKENEYENIFKNFKNSDENNIIQNIRYIKKYIYKKYEEDTENNSSNESLPNNEELNFYIISFTNKYMNNKSIISSLKSFSIFINKIYNNKNFLLKKINYIIKLSNNQTLPMYNNYKEKQNYMISSIIKKINQSVESSNNVKKIIDEYIINDNDKKLLKAYPYFYKIINKCKKIYPLEYKISTLENILYKFDDNIYRYVYFLHSTVEINSKESAIYLLKNFYFENKPDELIDNIELKRGFIQNFINTKNGKNYILKYQPNRSIMELLINVYLKKITYYSLKNIETETIPNILSKTNNNSNLMNNITGENDITEKTYNNTSNVSNSMIFNFSKESINEHDNKLSNENNYGLDYMNYRENYNLFLLPDYIFINNDNSYCYLIKRYDTDLYKYFNILHNNNEILKFNNIIYILKFIISAVKFLHKHSIIHSDLKLENIVLNYKIYNDNTTIITDLKIIDFDVSLFDKVPELLNPIPEEYNKTLKNKKIRGTKLYMLNDKYMSFKNDIYSMGVIFLIILYKNIKIFALLKIKSIENNVTQKKLFIKCNNFLKNLNTLRTDLNIDENKYILLDLIYEFVENNNTYNFYSTINDKMRFQVLIDFIKDCLKTKYCIELLEQKYSNLLS